MSKLFDNNKNNSQSFSVWEPSPRKDNSDEEGFESNCSYEMNEDDDLGLEDTP